MPESVAIVGASHKPHRYSYRAQVMLMEKKHTVFPVSGNGRDILGVPGYTSVSQIGKPVDTVTLYLNPLRHRPILQEILDLAPRRIIFNPGTESSELMAEYEAHGIEALQACTLVMIQTGTF
jgi:predicted CoA-binding protein